MPVAVVVATLDALDAVLDAWYPGLGGGEAVAATLLGDQSPAGRTSQAGARILHRRRQMVTSGGGGGGGEARPLGGAFPTEQGAQIRPHPTRWHGHVVETFHPTTQAR